MTSKPMPALPADFDALRFPLRASFKPDGACAAVQGGEILSRLLKEISNRHVQAWAADLPELEGLDGVIVGAPDGNTRENKGLERPPVRTAL